MITESDVRAVLAEQAHDISEPEDILNRLTVHRPAGRRRWIAPVAAAAAVAAVVSLAVTLGRHSSRHSSTTGTVHTLPPMPGRELRFTVTVGPVAGYQIDSGYLLADRESVDVELSGGRGIIAGEVVAYNVGSYNPASVKRGKHVTVQGHPGYFAGTPSSSDEADHVPSPSQVSTLAWEFAPNRWVVVQGWDGAGTPELQRRHVDPFTEEMRVAAAVDTSTTAPLLLPYRVGYLPSGLTHGGGRGSSLGGSDWDSYLWFLGPGQGSRDPDPKKPALTITAEPADIARQAPPVTGNTFTLDGHRAVYDDGKTLAPMPSLVPRSPVDRVRPAQLSIDLGPAVVIISGSYSRAELIKIARSITLAPNVADRSTWFDAAK